MCSGSNFIVFFSRSKRSCDQEDWGNGRNTVATLSFGCEIIKHGTVIYSPNTKNKK